ncbi:hypothetical protein IBX65_00260 [Candidatus Aerophobetes bacterium]|nr:hypothetical protein [Candidatus Aerophobetes bacterium]
MSCKLLKLSPLRVIFLLSIIKLTRIKSFRNLVPNFKNKDRVEPRTIRLLFSELLRCTDRTEKLMTPPLLLFIVESSSGCHLKT